MSSSRVYSSYSSSTGGSQPAGEPALEVAGVGYVLLSGLRKLDVVPEAEFEGPPPLLVAPPSGAADLRPLTEGSRECGMERSRL